ncbi:MAG TPA: hypothetical protein VH877_16785 [Polyangia bacterium]|nr:hypothetical protein [Polyangia bacterium]
MKRFDPTHLLPLLLVTTTSCAGIDGDPGGDTASPSAVETRGTLLTRVPLGGRHAVEFYALADQSVALREVGDLGDIADRVDVPALAGKSLSDMYRALVHDDTAPVPLPLVAAEAKAAPAAERTAAPPLAGPALTAVGSAKEAGAPDQGARRAPPTKDGTGALLAIDPTSDATWWTQNFCGTSDADGVWCPTNIGGATSGWRPTMYYEATGMSASSTATATYFVDEWQNGAWVRIVTSTLQARSWEKWWFQRTGWWRSGVSGALVHFAERFRNATPSFTALSDHPFDRSYEAANDMQGVTHDATSWYFTNAKTALGDPQSHIWKYPVTTDVNNDPSPYYSNPWQGTYNHFGDIVQTSGVVYVALEASGGSASRAAFGAFNTQLQYYGYGVLPAFPSTAPAGADQGGSCPWVAYNPRDGLFYSSSFNPAYLNKYSIGIYSTAPRVRVTYQGSVKLYDSAGTALTLQRIQGGKFSSSGKLYLSQDVQGGGLVVIDVYDGRLQTRIPVQFDPAGENEELEGLDLWDLEDGRAPGILGHVHVILVQNDIFSNDNFYFKHFRVGDFLKL